MFKITGPSGKTSSYSGVLLYRDTAIETDFITLKPNEVVTEEIDLSNYYNFEETGTHTVQLELSPFIEITKNQETIQINVSATLSEKSIELINSISKLNQDPSIMNINCNPSDTSKVNIGKQLGQRYSSCGQNCLARNSCNTLYTTWFGALSADRYSRVSTNFRAITSGLGGSYPCHCRPSQHCASNIIAYVYPSDRTRTVYLCSLYFSRSDADAGHTILHEMAHFDSVAGTRDHCYGRTACMNLARSNPANAVACADNHAFFGHDCR